MGQEVSALSGLPFIKLRPLVGVDAAQVDASFEELVRRLDGAALTGTIRLTLVGDPQAQRVTISVRDGGVQRITEGEQADLEIITTPEIWLAVAEGKRAPLDVFTAGQMRVRGSRELGRRVMIHLAGGAGMTDFC